VRIRIDPFALVGIAFLGFLVFNALADWGRFSFAPVEARQAAAQLSDRQAIPQIADSSSVATPLAPPPAAPVDTPAAPNPANVDDLRYPYDVFTLSQGPHGMSYGHMAIDLTGGKGAVILSPINGVVADRYIDEYGNTTILIENTHYLVTMLHGHYSVAEGEQVSIGQPVGTESNQGYTLGPGGVYCGAQSDCGYHTHLNIYDKYLGSNVNPIEVIKKW